MASVSDPVKIFQNYWAEARAVGDPNAPYCTLATVDTENQVSLRTLVLRGASDDGFEVFINETSPKWRDLQSAASAELQVFWPTLMQQYRVRGEFLEIPVEAMAVHWSQKPYEAKLLDYYYLEFGQQSSPLVSRDALVEGIASLKERFSTADEIPFPGNAKGIAVRPNFVEVWHGSAEDRLHHRRRFERRERRWVCTELVP